MKKIIRKILVLLLLICLVACGGNEEKTDTTIVSNNLANKNFINVYEDEISEKHSSINFSSTTDFVMHEYQNGNLKEIKGTYVIKNKEVVLSVNEDEIKEIILKVVNDSILTLNTKLYSSFKGNTYILCDDELKLETAIDSQRSNMQAILANKTFYNGIDHYGSGKRPSITFNDDSSFKMQEYNLEDEVVIEGTFEASEYKLYCKVDKCEAGDFASFEFYINDFENIILENNLFNSLSEDNFASRTFISTTVEEVPINGLFINASQKERNEFGTSSIELRADQSFTLTDIEGMGATQVEGEYGRQEDVLMFSFDDELYDCNGEQLHNFEFRVIDNNTLELMRDLGGSLAGDCFSIDGKVPNNYVAIYKSEEIACTGLKSTYKSYWAIANPANVYNLGVSALPENCTETITYSSDDESVAKVDQAGNVTPVNVGKTTIHVGCGKQKLDLSVESRPKSIPVESINLTVDRNIIAAKGEKIAYLNAEVYPTNASINSVEWKQVDDDYHSFNIDGNKAEVIAKSFNDSSLKTISVYAEITNSNGGVIKSNVIEIKVEPDLIVIQDGYDCRLPESTEDYWAYKHLDELIITTNIEAGFALNNRDYISQEQVGKNYLVYTFYNDEGQPHQFDLIINTRGGQYQEYVINVYPE